MKTLEFKEKSTPAKFMEFRMERREFLLKARSKREIRFGEILKACVKVLSPKYRLVIIPQKSFFIKNYGLAYIDYYLKSVNKLNYGKRFCIEFDEPYHDGKNQNRLDRGREKAVIRKKRIVDFIRVKSIEMANEKVLFRRLLTELDWWH